LVKYFTKEEYGHIGIALRLDHRLTIFEASIPFVHIDVPKKDTVFSVIPMDIAVPREAIDFLFDQIGSSYGFMDAYRSLVGKSVKMDNQWQCAEYVLEFYNMCGIYLASPPIPGQVAKAVTAYSGRTPIPIRV
jgi:hypothetical protein